MFPTDDCEMSAPPYAPDDPINVVAYGYGTNEVGVAAPNTGLDLGNANDARRQIHGHNLEWDGKPAERWFKTHLSGPTVCAGGTYAMATGYLWESRWHIRMAATPHASHASCSWCVGGELNYTTLIGAHRDALVRCKKKKGGIWRWIDTHYVPIDGYNKARWYVVNPMRDDGHYIKNVDWGNTRLRKQCTGQPAGSSGIIAFFKTNSSHHGAWGEEQ